MAKQAAVATQAIGEYIDIGLLSPSPTNPRKRFYDNTLEELAGSIRAEGIIEPLIVRLNHQSTEDDQRTAFEIVCGERRYRAAKLAELASVPCIVRELTDEQVLDIQIHENLHREDVHPMDEAYGYQFLLDKLKCTPAEVAARVGKSEKYVLTRLKLNSLIDEAQTDLENGHLLLTYALEIAKFSPEIQKQILDNAAYERQYQWTNGKDTYTPIKEQRANWNKFIGYINQNILGLLSAAKFDIKATNLRKDGLACLNCSERTGANVGLFEADQVDKKDSCLNPGCYKAKHEEHVQIIRQRVAHEASIKESQVPWLELDNWNDRKIDIGTTYGYDSITIIGKKPKGFYGSVSDKPCDKSVTGVEIGSGQFGKTYTVCFKNSGCKIHGRGHSGSSASSTSSVGTDAVREQELIKKRKRREELVDVRVGNEVRARVFRLAAEKFAQTFSINGGGNDFLPLLITKIWTNDNGNDGTTKQKIVRPVLAAIMDVKPDKISFGGWDSEGTAKDIAKLTVDNQHKLLFLLVHGNSGAMYYERYESQKPVKALADEYGIDYRLIDAEERLKWAEEKAKKHVPAFKLYLDAVRSGDSKAKIPRPYAETYKPKD